MKQLYSVYWRAKDGNGTRTWKTGLTETEATAQIRWCEGAHPEATLVWITQAGAARAHTVHQRMAPTIDWPAGGSGGCCGG